MKVFFGSAINDMLTELRGQSATTVRLHVLPKTDGQNLVMYVYVTSLSSDQIFESVTQVRTSLADVPQDQVGEFIRQRCEEEHKKMSGRLEGFEVRRGIIQP